MSCFSFSGPWPDNGEFPRPQPPFKDQVVKRAILVLFVWAAVTIHAAPLPHGNLDLTSTNHTAQIVELEIGQPLDLASFKGGPNVQFVVTSADSYNVSFTTVDFERMPVIVNGGNGGSQPTRARQQVAINGEATLLFRRNGLTVLYGGSAGMNRVALRIVTE